MQHRNNTIRRFRFDVMDRLFLRRFLPLVLAILTAAGPAVGPVCSAEKPHPRVLLLPFEANAPPTMAYLQEEVPKVLGRRLSQEGAVILDPPPDLQQPQPWSPERIRREGIAAGADYVVWGSITAIGQRYSIDARILEIFGTRPVDLVAVEGTGLETLPLQVQQLAEELMLTIFRQQKIVEIRISGNRRIEADAIHNMIQSSPGEIYSVKSLSEDLEAVYSMGYFDDVRIEAEDTPDGKAITFIVEEKPTIRRIRFDGNRIYDDEELQENITLKTGSILNVFTIRNNLQRIETLYREKNFHNVKVDYQIESLENNQADLAFVIEEGEKLRISKITFIGNKAYSRDELLDEMATSEKGFWSFLTESGDLKNEELDQDVGRLENFYHNHGYIRAKVGEPQVDFLQDAIEVTIKIDEGPQFRVGSVDVQGDLIFPREELLQKTKLNEEEFYNRTVLRNDLLLLTDLYGDAGYAYADVTPRIDEDADRLIVDIVYQINKGEQVFFEEIIISGNTKTRDKVIRRQLEVHEQGLYSGTRMKRSIRNLYRLDYFQDVRVNTVKGSADDKMVLNIDVEEKSTGQFSFGGGYSNTESVFLMAAVAQRNFLGRGQNLTLRGELGGKTTRLLLGFTEPWLFDIPLSAGFRIYRWEREFDAYDRDSWGGAVSFGYPVFRNTRATISIGYDNATIEVDDPAGLPISIEELVQEFGDDNIITLNVEGGLRYDTRDRVFSATEGSNHFVTVEYAGFGGDIGFVKTVGQLSWYIPLWWDFVGFVRGKGGYVTESGDGFLPDYEKFFLGGIDSVRGFDEDDINPVDFNGNKIGGDEFAFANVELIRPLMRDLGLDGFVFFDIGAVVADDAADPAQRTLDPDAFRESVGLGIRWNSPMGPIGIAYGIKLDKQDDEDSGNWEFALGAAF